MRGFPIRSGICSRRFPGSCISLPVAALFLIFVLSPVAAGGEPIEYPGGGASPDSAIVGEIIEFSISVSNAGSEAIGDVWMSLDIYDEVGVKVESSRGDYSGGFIYWNERGITLDGYAAETFTARYYLGVSSAGHAFGPGNYTLKYATWSGQPGAPGSEQLGELQAESLTVEAISTAAVVVPILMYHRVDDSALNEYWVLASEFEAQMKALSAHGYESIGTADVYHYNYRGGTLPEKPVIISFDDGYENLYTHAYPILMQEGLFGEACVITDYVGFSALSRRYVRMLSSGPLSYPHLTWPEIIEMAANGMVFGSHTLTHRELPTLSASEIEAELRDSKQALLDHAGISATSFSYPYGEGHADPEIHQLLARFGYSTAVAAWGGLEETGCAKSLDLKRIYVYGPNPVAQPTSGGVSVDYDPTHPADFFMTKIDPDFPVPLIRLESVEFLDELGNARENDVFYRSEIILIRIRARNAGAASDVAVSLRLDNDAGTEPVQYNSSEQAQDISRFFETTFGSAEVFDFIWEVPANAPLGTYDYSVKFHDETWTLGFASTGWVLDQFRVCDNIHLLQPADGASFRAAPTFVWEPGCNDRFAVEFSYSPSFSSPRRTQILSTTSFTMPKSVWQSVPLYRKIYWRVLGADSAIEPLQVNQSEEIRSFQRGL